MAVINEQTSLEGKDKALRLRILRSCKEQFFKFGIRSVTMDDIANALGMSKKTIYQYFQNKDEIVLGVVNEHICDSEADLRRIVEASQDPIDALLTSMRHDAQQFEQMSPLMIPELKKYFHEAWQHIHTFECEQWIRLLREVIIQGQEQGLFRPDANAELVAVMHTAGFDAIVFSDHPMLQKYSYAQRHGHYELALLYSLVTEKGRAKLEAYIQTHGNQTR